jgi:probable HAF family extracellular repeat protein
MVGLGSLPGDLRNSSEATGVSADGSAVVGLSDSAPGAQNEAFRWTSGEGMVSLGFLPGGGSNSLANAVSADGSTAVGLSDTALSNYEAFRWTSSEGMVGLGYLPGGGLESVATAVSADGSIVVGGSDTSDPQSGDLFEAFRWTSGGGMVGLGLLPGGFRSTAYAVSADGSVVVGQGESAAAPEAFGEAFRWTSSGGMVALGLLPGADNSIATAVSADGSVVVGVSITMVPGGGGSMVGVPEAFIWDAAHGTRSLEQVLTNDFGLDLTGWTLGGAEGISADGLTIVGTGGNPSGQGEAWITFIPEPGTPLLLLTGLLALAARARRRA